MLALAAQPLRQSGPAFRALSPAKNDDPALRQLDVLDVPPSRGMTARAEAAYQTQCRSARNRPELSGSHRRARGKASMSKDELVIQLVKVGLGILIGGYFLWWSLEVLKRLPPVH
jgi:hypothetical protein